MKYFVYIIYSPGKDRYYIGFTGDSLEERIRKHNSNHKGFTGGSVDWELKYNEEFDSKSEAVLREKQLKSWKSRSKIEQLFQRIPT